MGEGILAFGFLLFAAFSSDAMWAVAAGVFWIARFFRILLTAVDETEEEQ